MSHLHKELCHNFLHLQHPMPPGPKHSNPGPLALVVQAIKILWRVRTPVGQHHKLLLQLWRLQLKQPAHYNLFIWDLKFALQHDFLPCFQHSYLGKPVHCADLLHSAQSGTMEDAVLDTVTPLGIADAQWRLLSYWDFSVLGHESWNWNHVTNLDF